MSWGIYVEWNMLIGYRETGGVLLSERVCTFRDHVSSWATCSLNGSGSIISGKWAGWVSVRGRSQDVSSQRLLSFTLGLFCPTTRILPHLFQAVSATLIGNKSTSAK